MEAETDATLMSKHDVLRLLGITECSLRRWMTAGKFPRPLALSPKVHRWHRVEVESWLARQPRSNAA